MATYGKHALTASILNALNILIHTDIHVLRCKSILMTEPYIVIWIMRVSLGHRFCFWFLMNHIVMHDAVIKWKHFQYYWPFVRGIHRSPVNSPHKSQWRGALMFSLICAWINGWVNNREAGDLRRNHAHYDVTVLFFLLYCWIRCLRIMRNRKEVTSTAYQTLRFVTWFTLPSKQLNFSVESR